MGKIEYKKEYYGLINKLLNLSGNYYGERLVSVVVFGSVASDAFRPDSDIDILIVAEDLPERRWMRISEFIENIENKLSEDLQKLYDSGITPSFSPVIKSRDEVRHGSPLFLDMTESAMILYDRDNFFHKYLDDLKKKLTDLGAKKIALEDGYYWDLKPDYKYGDIIEL